LPEKLSDTSKLITPFGAKAFTASGDELQITGRCQCEIQLGETSCSTGVLVYKEVSDELLMGIDFLTACEITRPHVEVFVKQLKRHQKN
jgi:hypothetical protein